MSDRYKRGLVALSGDPITRGHLDLIARAAAKCRELIVLVADNDRKKGSYLYQLSDRTAMTERAVADLDIRNARVIGSSGLLVDVYLREGCDRLFRGVRNAKDLDYEEEQHELNAMILPDLKGRIEYIQAADGLKLISSTMAKAFVDHYLDVDAFVPMFVKQSLEERLLGQFRIGITGGIAVGKSWVAAELANQLESSGIKATHINVDKLLRELYDEDSPGAQEVRDAIADRFGREMLGCDGKTVVRPLLAERLFREGRAAKVDRDFVTELTMPHVERKYRETLKGVRGLVLVEWAQLAEMGMGSWTNNNVIVVDSPDRAVFAAERGIDPRRIALMDKIQWHAVIKVTALDERAKRDKNGTVLTHANIRREHIDDARDDVGSLAVVVRTLFPGLENLS